MMGRSSLATVRQFARAVFADRLIGDELTRLAFTKAELDPSSNASSARDLMRAFLRSWRLAADGGDRAGALFTDQALIDALPPPPSEERLMLLLVDVIGFSLTEAEWILNPMQDDPETALEKGRAIVDLPRQATALIIEDEPMIAADLRSILGQIGVAVCGYASTASSAVAALDKAKPDVILADYSLGDDETGVDAVRKIQDIHDCPVIFITGFPDKVLRGDEVEPDFVISKPFSRESVRAAVAHCLDTDRAIIAEA